jgi:hypothetical protein
MDVTLTVSDERDSAGMDVSGSYRFVKRAGTPTFASRDGGPWEVFGTGGSIASPLRFLPMLISSTPLAGHGEFLCALGALDTVASADSDGGLQFDVERAAALRAKSDEAYVETVLAASKFDAAKKSCIRRATAQRQAEAPSESAFERVLPSATATIRRDVGDLVLTQQVKNAAGEITQRETITFQSTRWSIPQVERLPEQREDLTLAALSLARSATGC